MMRVFSLPGMVFWGATASLLVNEASADQGNGVDRCAAYLAEPSDAYRFLADGGFRNCLMRAQLSEENAVKSRIRLKDGSSVMVVQFSDHETEASRIQFEDGSSVRVRQEGGGPVAYVWGTAFDANHVLIPDASHVPVSGGGYEALYGGWNPHNLGDWLDAAARVGIPIRHDSHGAGTHMVLCTAVPEKLIECTVQVGGRA